MHIVSSLIIDVVQHNNPSKGKPTLSSRVEAAVIAMTERQSNNTNNNANNVTMQQLLAALKIDLDPHGWDALTVNDLTPLEVCIYYRSFCNIPLIHYNSVLFYLFPPLTHITFNQLTKGKASFSFTVKEGHCNVAKSISFLIPLQTF